MTMMELLTVGMQCLCEELTVQGLGLLYELLLAAQQGSWCDEHGSFFTVHWIVDLIEQLNHQQLVSRRQYLLVPLLKCCDYPENFCSSLEKREKL